MFAVLAWTTVEVERVSGLAALRPDAMAALHESPFKYLAALSPQQVRISSFRRSRGVFGGKKGFTFNDMQ